MQLKRSYSTSFDDCEERRSSLKSSLSSSSSSSSSSASSSPSRTPKKVRFADELEPAAAATAKSPESAAQLDVKPADEVDKRSETSGSEKSSAATAAAPEELAGNPDKRRADKSLAESEAENAKSKPTAKSNPEASSSSSSSSIRHADPLTPPATCPSASEQPLAEETAASASSPKEGKTQQQQDGNANNNKRKLFPLFEFAKNRGKWPTTAAPSSITSTTSTSTHDPQNPHDEPLTLVPGRRYLPDPTPLFEARADFKCTNCQRSFSIRIKNRTLTWSDHPNQRCSACGAGRRKLVLRGQYQLLWDCEVCHMPNEYYVWDADWGRFNAPLNENNRCSTNWDRCAWQRPVIANVYWDRLRDGMGLAP